MKAAHTGTGNLNSDPHFASPADASNAPTSAGDYYLQLGSPAIDAGDNSAVAAHRRYGGQSAPDRCASL